jgi:hypothetical protein
LAETKSPDRSPHQRNIMVQHRCCRSEFRPIGRSSWQLVCLFVIGLLVQTRLATANYIYFNEYQEGSSGTIWRAQLDGSDRQLVLTTGPYRSYDFAVDQRAGQIYWTEWRWPARDAIMRANLDGTGRQQILTSTDNSGDFWALFVDQVNQKLYYSEGNVGIKRSNLDGTNAQLIYPQTTWDWFQRLAINPQDEKLYFNYVNGGIGRIALDGGNYEMLVTGNRDRRAVAIDPEAEKIYWSEDGLPTYGPADTIKRANLDGTGVETLLTVRDTEITSLAVDAAGGKLYFADDHWTTAMIYRADLSGSNIEVIARPALSTRAESHTVVLALSPPGLVGDANEDGVVDRADLAILVANYGTISGALREHGDFDANGRVNLRDLQLLQAHYGKAGGSAAAAVPEPGMFELGLVAVIAMHGVCVLRRRSSGLEC